MHPKPTNEEELFAFYDQYVKVLYSGIQSENKLPDETLFEINAAFDHFSRIWVYRENKTKAIEKVFAHLKRSCLDIFKITVKRTIVQYENELKKIDISLIDGGRFEHDLRALIQKIKIGARKARQSEGIPDTDDAEVTCFDLWEPVYDDCVLFNEKFYNHKDIEWAKKKTDEMEKNKKSQASKKRIIDHVVGFILGIIASLVAAFIYTHLISTPTATPSTLPAKSSPTSNTLPVKM
jgi:hypothetical protein